MLTTAYAWSVYAFVPRPVYNTRPDKGKLLPTLKLLRHSQDVEKNRFVVLMNLSVAVVFKTSQSRWPSFSFIRTRAMAPSISKLSQFPCQLVTFSQTQVLLEIHVILHNSNFRPQLRRHPHHHSGLASPSRQRLLHHGQHKRQQTNLRIHTRLLPTRRPRHGRRHFRLFHQQLRPREPGLRPRNARR